MFTKILLRGLAIASVVSGYLFADDKVTRAPYNSVVGSGVTTTQGISSSKLNNSVAASTGLFNISQSGYYYFSDDIQPLGVTNDNPIIRISASNVVLDFATKAIIAPTDGTVNKITAGVQVDAGISNIVIKNGTVSGITGTSASDGFGVVVNQSGGNAVTNITLENLMVNNCGYFGVAVNNCNNLLINGIQCVDNGPDSDQATTGIAAGFAGGCLLKSVTSATINNASFSNNAWQAGVTATNGVNIIGLLLNACTSVKLNGGQANGNINTTTNAVSSTATSYAAGVLVQDSSSSLFMDFTASSNTDVNSTALGRAYGIYVHSTTAPYSTTNTFQNCTTSNNSGWSFAAGIAFDTTGTITASSNANQCVGCRAELNNITSTVTAAIAAHAYGFYCNTTASNTFRTCNANANTVPGSTTADTARTAVGFYSAGGAAQQFIDCQANRNNLSSAETVTFSTVQAPAAFAAGIQLGDTLSLLETGSIIRGGSVNNNTTLVNTTTAPCFGIIILPTEVGPYAGPYSKGNIIESVTASTNLSANTAQGYSYGIVDLTPGTIAEGTASTDDGSTTLLRANISIGQGKVFNSNTQVNAFGSNNMNYYIDFQTSQMKLTNAVKETNLANLNNIADINGYQLFNWSFTTS